MSSSLSGLADGEITWNDAGPCDEGNEQALKDLTPAIQ